MTAAFFTVYYKTPKTIEKRDTTIIRDTVWKDTTITEKELIPKFIVKKKVDTLYLKDGRDTLLVTESKMFDKRLTTSKDTADLQIYTTGINTSLDSLKWRLKTHRVNTTETVEIIKYEEQKNKLVKFRPSITFGYDPLNKQWGLVVGFGLNIGK
jgi:hypothetical protein